VEESVI